MYTTVEPTSLCSELLCTCDSHVLYVNNDLWAMYFVHHHLSTLFQGRVQSCKWCHSQSMKQELMHNGYEWLSPNVVGTNRVSNLWNICRRFCKEYLSFTSMQKTTTYSRLVHFSTVRTTVSEILVKDGELGCPSIVLLSKNQLWTFMDFCVYTYMYMFIHV